MFFIFFQNLSRMPAVKRKRASTKGKGKRSRKSRAPRRIPRISQAPFPSQKVAKLRYVENFQVTSPADGLTLALKHFSANSIYDPNRSIGGHQPYGHDQFQLLYQHYEVLEAKIKCTFTCGDTDKGPVASTICAIRMNGSVGVGSPLDEITMLESPDVVYGVMTPGTGKLVLNHSFRQKDLYPTTHMGLTALFGQDPSEQAFFTLAFGSGSAAAASTDVLLEIEYKCRFFEPKALAMS
uniref:Capsid protein n=1 Tax=uncultured marine virus TaxID=186617 RepID=S4TE77_9VIRU|nr:hypothetical protein [uncultured marine virus]